MLPEVEAWFERRTSHMRDWDADVLAGNKQGQRISVVLPARNESATVGTIVSSIRTALCERVPLVDEIVVIDSRQGLPSTTKTRSAPTWPPGKGKGRRCGSRCSW